MDKNYWYYDDKTDLPELDKDLKTDVMIIGGGLAGMMCAYELTERGYKVCIAEAKTIGGGETRNSSAMVAYTHDLIYDRLIDKHGIDTACRYIELNKRGLEKIARIVEDNSLDCGFARADMYLFATTKKGAADIVKEHKAFERMGHQSEIVESTELPYFIEKALKVENQAYLDPYKFVIGMRNILLKRGAIILEHCPVTEEPLNNKLALNGHEILADNYVIATHFPYINMPGYYFAKMYQSRSHNVVFKSNTKLKNLYESVEEDGFEYRPVNSGILCGGANIRTGKYGHESQYKILEKHIKEKFGCEYNDIAAEFAAQDCMTFDMLPFVGKYSRGVDNVYVVTGFNKWGFTTSAAAADIIADSIEGKNQDGNIFDPRRIYALKNPIKAARNLGTVMGSYIERLLISESKKIDNIEAGQGAVIRNGINRIGVYKTLDGEIKAINAVCPHMGCSLSWNKDECTWDCACHGSRFDVDGNIISNPSIDKAKSVNRDK